MDVLKNVCDGKRQFFFETKEGYKVSCVKILIFGSVIRRLVFIWNKALLIHCQN